MNTSVDDVIGGAKDLDEFFASRPSARDAPDEDRPACRTLVFCIRRIEGIVSDVLGRLTELGIPPRMLSVAETEGDRLWLSVRTAECDRWRADYATEQYFPADQNIIRVAQILPVPEGDCAIPGDLHTLSSHQEVQVRQHMRARVETDSPEQVREFFERVGGRVVHAYLDTVTAAVTADPDTVDAVTRALHFRWTVVRSRVNPLIVNAFDCERAFGSGELTAERSSGEQESDYVLTESQRRYVVVDGRQDWSTRGAVSNLLATLQSYGIRIAGASNTEESRKRDRFRLTLSLDCCDDGAQERACALLRGMKAVEGAYVLPGSQARQHAILEVRGAQDPAGVSRDIKRMGGKVTFALGNDLRAKLTDTPRGLARKRQQLGLSAVRRICEVVYSAVALAAQGTGGL